MNRVDQRKWILILDSDLIKATIVNTGMQTLIFFGHEKNPAPKGEVQGQIMPEAKESST